MKILQLTIILFNQMKQNIAYAVSSYKNIVLVLLF